MSSKYVKGELLGEGTWGHVFAATKRGQSEKFAIKRIKPMERHLGINFTALREIKHLRVVKHLNIINLEEVFMDAGVLHLVLEFCPFDMEKIIRDKSILLRTTQVKSYMRMILKGIECCHDNFILHRDLKPANLLIGRDGQVKLADFGLARCHSSPERMTSEVVTRWYRCPELLFGANLYSAGVDIWAVGCIFAEIILRVPLFPGDTDIEQLSKIFNVLGTPNEKSWPDISLLPNYIELQPRDPIDLIPLFRKSQPKENNSKNGSSSVPLDLDLLLKMFTFDPKKRITATQALQHPYFRQAPIACLIEELPLPKGISKDQMDYENKKRGFNQITTTSIEVDTKRQKI